MPPATSKPDYLEEENGIDDTPAWYDPIYNRIFSDLRTKYKQLNPVLMMNSKNLNTGLTFKGLRKEAGGNQSVPAWHLEVEECPVQCGGGWTRQGYIFSTNTRYYSISSLTIYDISTELSPGVRVEPSCEASGETVPEELCDQVI